MIFIKQFTLVHTPPNDDDDGPCGSSIPRVLCIKTINIAIEWRILYVLSILLKVFSYNTCIVQMTLVVILVFIYLLNKYILKRTKGCILKLKVKHRFYRQANFYYTVFKRILFITIFVNIMSCVVLLSLRITKIFSDKFVNFSFLNFMDQTVHT